MTQPGPAAPRPSWPHHVVTDLVDPPWTGARVAFVVLGNGRELLSLEARWAMTLGRVGGTVNAHTDVAETLDEARSDGGDTTTGRRSARRVLARGTTASSPTRTPTIVDSTTPMPQRSPTSRSAASARRGRRSGAGALPEGRPRRMADRTDGADVRHRRQSRSSSTPCGWCSTATTSASISSCTRR